MICVSSSGAEGFKKIKLHPSMSILTGSGTPHSKEPKSEERANSIKTETRSTVILSDLMKAYSTASRNVQNSTKPKEKLAKSEPVGKCIGMNPLRA